MTGLHERPDREARLLRMAQGNPDDDLMRHVAACADCQEELVALRELVRYGTTTGGAMAEAPPLLVDRMSALMPRVRPDLIAQNTPSVVGQVAGAVRRVVAELLLDTGATPQVAGLRGGGDRRTRQLAFVSEVADLDLEVSQREGGYTVAGQLGMDTVPPNLHIRFVPADQDPLAEDVAGLILSPISHGGYFELTLTAGEWVAAVDIEDAVVLFPGVRV